MIVTIRPEPGASATLAAGRECGLELVSFPLFEVQKLAWDAPDPAAVDALLIGSANAIRHGGSGLALYREKPVHAVGAATAEAARDHGFAVASVGQGGLQSLLDGMAKDGIRLLRLAGAENVDLTVPPHIEVTARIVYEVVALPLPARLQQLLQRGATVLLHSAAAARHFHAECNRLGFDLARISLACLGPRIAAAAGEGWAALRSAPQPTDAALLALARELCH